MNYYRKNVDNTANDLKLKMQMAAFTLKLSENNDKIDDLLKADKDIKKDIIDNSNSIKNFYTKQDVNNIISQYYLKKNIDSMLNNYYLKSNINNKINDRYDKNYIDNNYYNKNHIDDNFLVKSDIDKKDNNILNNINNNFYSRSYINDNYLLKGSINNNFYDKNYINNLTNNLYNRTYLNNKFDNIYTKTEVNTKTSKLDRNIILFNQNLTKFIDETYKNKITELENKNSLTDTQITKINQLENIDLNKINSFYNFSVFNKAKLDNMRYYISEFIPVNITLVKKFTFTGNTNEIMILQFELDQRTFDIDDIINFFLNITIQYDNSKSNWYRLKLKLDILYDDDTLTKSFVKMPVSKGFLYQHLINFNINRFLKLSKKTKKIIFKIYMSKINTALVDNIIFNLNQKYENDYCHIIHYKIV